MEIVEGTRDGVYRGFMLGALLLSGGLWTSILSFVQSLRQHIYLHIIINRYIN